MTCFRTSVQWTRYFAKNSSQALGEDRANCAIAFSKSPLFICPFRWLQSVTPDSLPLGVTDHRRLQLFGRFHNLFADHVVPCLHRGQEFLGTAGKLLALDGGLARGFHGSLLYNGCGREVTPDHLLAEYRRVVAHVRA